MSMLIVFVIIGICLFIAIIMIPVKLADISRDLSRIHIDLATNQCGGYPSDIQRELRNKEGTHED